jgi:hypothetical protein
MIVRGQDPGSFIASFSTYSVHLSPMAAGKKDYKKESPREIRLKYSNNREHFALQPAGHYTHRQRLAERGNRTFRLNQTIID